MKKLKIILLVLSVALISCKSEKTLEQYFIVNEDNKDIVIIDVPVNIVKNVADFSKEEQKAINSVQKLNVLYLKKATDNKTEFEKQKHNLQTILKNKKYQTLSKVKDGKTNIDIKFIGTDQAINEVVLFATDSDKGFFLARILGDNMNPENMQMLLKSVNEMDLDLSQIKKFNLNL
ncbi:MAG TPA: DUF4252 domain-containing protein [Flavobacteriia bacterium]|nr:DUF4252 domain-containing protein [Flavobacteriia bacterium]